MSHEVGQWWPQNPPSLFDDGTWQALCWIGAGENMDIGKKFDIGVVLVTEVEAKRLTDEIKAGNVQQRPPFGKIYARITVTRK